MDDAALVGSVSRASQSLYQLGRRAGRLRNAAQLLRQAAAFDMLQRKVRNGGIDIPRSPFPHLINGHYVRVLEAGHGFGLALKPEEVVTTRKLHRPDHFQGDHPAQRSLPGLIDDSHAAMTQFGQYLIAGDGRRRNVRSGERS